MPPRFGVDRLHGISAALANGASVVAWMSIRPEMRVWADFLSRLGPSDQARAMSFRFERDRIQLIASRVVLAKLVNAALQLPDSRWRFGASHPGAKPKLDVADGRQLFVNLSHTHGCVVVALNANAEVGVDVEAARGTLDLAGLAKLTMTEQEQSAISGDRQAEALFYRLWVRKEAVLKAFGWGVSVDPRTIDLLDPSKVLLPPGITCPLAVFDLHGPPLPAALCVLARDACVFPIPLDAEDL